MEVIYKFVAIGKPDFVRFEVKPLSSSEVAIECVVDNVLRPGEVRLYRIEEKHFSALDAEIVLVPVPHDKLQSVTTTVRANYTFVKSGQNRHNKHRPEQFQCAVVYPNSDVNVTRNKVMFSENNAVRGHPMDRGSLAFILLSTWLLSCFLR